MRSSLLMMAAETTPQGKLPMHLNLTALTAPAKSAMVCPVLPLQLLPLVQYGTTDCKVWILVTYAVLWYTGLPLTMCASTVLRPCVSSDWHEIWARYASYLPCCLLVRFL